MKNELQEIATADAWSDIGYVAFGWVRRSRNYPRVGSSSSNIYTGPFGSHTYASATDSNANFYKHINTDFDEDTATNGYLNTNSNTDCNANFYKHINTTSD